MAGVVFTEYGKYRNSGPANGNNAEQKEEKASRPTPTVADYHLQIQTISRKRKYSAVDAAAYRSGSALRDYARSTRGRLVDYTTKGENGGVLETALIGWLGSREELWNAAERAEKRADATTAREFQGSIPIELTPVRRSRLVMRYAQWIADRFGVAVDVAIHRAGGYAKKDNNPHFHILASTRACSIETGEFAATKYRDFAATEGTKKKQNTRAGAGKDTLYEVREMWARMANEALAEQGATARIDHRSYAARGIDREPGIHRGSQGKDQRQGEGWRTRAGSFRAQIARERATRNRLKEITAKAAQPVRRAVDLVGPQQVPPRQRAIEAPAQPTKAAPPPAPIVPTISPTLSPDETTETRREIERELVAAAWRAARSKERQAPQAIGRTRTEPTPMKQKPKGPRL